MKGNKECLREVVCMSEGTNVTIMPINKTVQSRTER